MDLLSPTILKLLAAGAFGTATALLGLGAYRLAALERVDSGVYTGPSMRRAELRRAALEQSTLLVLALPWLRLMAGLIQRINPQALLDYVREPYAKAGYPGGLEDEEVLAIGAWLGIALTIFLGFSAAVFFGPMMIWAGLLGLPVGFLAVVSNLKTRAELRRLEILRAMPYVLDLLVLILRSGASLTIALTRVVEDYRHHPFGEELEQVLAEMNVGASRSESMKRLAERVEIDDVNALADSIVQSEELGWPLADTLERLSDRLAAERQLRAQSAAGAAGVLVMLPSTLVLMGAVLLLFGPTIVRLLRSGLALS